MTDTLWSASTVIRTPYPIERKIEASWLDTTVLVGFILYTFVGTQPFADGAAGSRTDGNILDRIVVIALFCLSLVVLWQRRTAAFACIRANFIFLLLVGFCLLSLSWSDYPELTLRRAVLLIFLTVIAMAVAVSTDDFRRLHTILFFGLSAIILISLLGAVIAPSRAMADNGLRGLYTQKNVAGIVGMITLILGATWLMGARGGKQYTLALLALVMTLLFLILTRSKTSIGLALFGLLVIGTFGLAEKIGPRFILLAGTLGLLLLSAGIAWLVLNDFDTELALVLMVNDTSFSGRDELWQFARREAEKRTWFGHGYGAYWDVGLSRDPLTRAEAGSWLSSVEIGIINQAHNGYLELWLHIGLPATALATILMIRGMFQSGIAALAGNGSVQLRALLGGICVVLVLFPLHNITEATLLMRGSLFSSMATVSLFLITMANHAEIDAAGIP